MVFYQEEEDGPYKRTDGKYTLNYDNRKLQGNQWPSPHQLFNAKGRVELSRTDEGLEAVPGYFQMRTMTTENGRKINAPIFVNEFQRRRGTGFKGPEYQKPLTRNFLSNYSNHQIYAMRHLQSMYKLPFWNPSKYTALQAHQWNQYLDEHPNNQHQLPVPTTPDSVLPPPPYPYGKADFYEIPDFNRKGHTKMFNKQGNAVADAFPSDEITLEILNALDRNDEQNLHRLNPRMEELARNSQYVVRDATPPITGSKRRNDGSSTGSSSGYDSARSRYSIGSNLSDIVRQLYPGTPITRSR